MERKQPEEKVLISFSLPQAMPIPSGPYAWRLLEAHTGNEEITQREFPIGESGKISYPIWLHFLPWRYDATQEKNFAVVAVQIIHKETGWESPRYEVQYEINFPTGYVIKGNEINNEIGLDDEAWYTWGGQTWIPYDPVYYSCFLSYSHKDEDFAIKLYSRLRREGIEIWASFANLLPGQKITDEVVAAIKKYDKLLIVLSAESMRSEWVQTEIRIAMLRGTEKDSTILFPITLVSIEEIKNWQCIDPDSGRDLAYELRKYRIADFSNWKDPKAFEMEARKVIDGLRRA